MELTADELRRYSRHLILPEIGLEGQKKIRGASVLCIGAGGLGSPIALYLAAAGIGKLCVVDFDTVEYSNLQRQVIHGTGDVGRTKTESAKETIQQINPNVEVVAHNVRLTSQNAFDILRPYDIVVDGTDNFPTRYLTNDACVLLKKPNVYGSIFRFEGQASVFAPHLGGPCYRCLYPEPPPPGLVPSCAEGGVLGVLPGIIGLIQATEILKLAVGMGTTLLNRLLLFDALGMKFRELKLRRDPQCPVCGERPRITELIDYEIFCGVGPAGKDKTMHPDEVTVQEMKRALDDPKLGIKVIDVREPDEYQIAHVEGVPLVPLSQLQQRFTELDPDQQYYIHCKMGGRSMQAVLFLRQQGFKQLKSVKGGITAWAEEIDPNVPKY
ncbi:MAG TPA: molybdopterin-synthase adenylyltransferase MoeB [Candidatus Binatia bacterium]|jgi:molybdopterin/thiamine biosynthesis adenylyltransferase/rhodanese-related sulfurtransferase|nr:molybdopterin-synthase adenylyltransferase MoeB [Candidatus Binatia bacterium]